MSLFHTNTLIGASGSGGDPLYVDDVFSTFLYEGTASTQTITNGIDLDGKGGLVWTKSRSAEGQHYLFDTERGATKYIRSNTANPETTDSNSLTAFNSDGFTIGSAENVNPNNVDLVSFSFRKAPGFFDVVTYTGNSTAGRTVSHNLGSVPGCIIVKCTSESYGWFVFHRSTGNNQQLRLDSTAAAASSTRWNSTDPTSTEFTLNDSATVNGSDETYVAYIFAHDDQSFGDDSDEAIIKCGSFTGANHTESLGFEPQLLFAKRTDTSANWHLINHISGFHPSSVGDSKRVRPDTITDESTSPFHVTQDGFYYSSSSATYAYIAIRRPHKPPEDGTDVFKSFAWSGNNTSQDLTVPFAPDFMHVQGTSIATTPHFIDNLRGKSKALVTSATDTESTVAQGVLEFYEDGAVKIGSDSTFNLNGYTYAGFSLKRVPGFFDMVAYAGDGTSNRNINHNLGVSPELLIVKSRSSSTYSWGVRTVGSGTLDRTGLALNYSASAQNSGFGTTGISAAAFNPYYVAGNDGSNSNYGSNNAYNLSGETYIAYLFATLDGISKVGSYSGTGSDINVDCGFAAGARFVLIKRTNGTGDWYWWDSVRGINAGNDPYARFNVNASQVTNTDYIDPLNSGFTVTSSSPDALNVNGGTYIFLAIA